MAKICYIYVKRMEDKFANDRKYCKVRDRCHCTGECRGTLHSIFNFKKSIPIKITVIFHTMIGSNYDYHFITKELAEELKRQFTYSGENTENI